MPMCGTEKGYNGSKNNPAPHPMQPATQLTETLKATILCCNAMIAHDGQNATQTSLV